LAQDGRETAVRFPVLARKGRMETMNEQVHQSIYRNLRTQLMSVLVLLCTN
jgi:hypothetical protein